MTDRLKILVRKNDDSVTEIEWADIVWADVKEIGLRSSWGVAGFNKQYGCPIWYQLKQETYDKPIFYILQRFWGKITGVWHQFYITETGTTRTPYYTTRDVPSIPIDERTMGWTGTINYGGNDFPVKVGVRCVEGSLPDYMKTEVTTPIDLEDHGIEYQIYLNPDYAGDAQKNIKWVRVFDKYYEGSQCGTYTDYDILTLMDITTIPSLPFYFMSFYNDAKTKCLGSFDFNDVFTGSTGRFIKIEQETTPLGLTYILKVGCTFGSLSSGETMVIDPSFTYDRWKTLHWDMKREHILYRTPEQIIQMKLVNDETISETEEKNTYDLEHPYILKGYISRGKPTLSIQEIDDEYDEQLQHHIDKLKLIKYYRDLLNTKILGY